MLQHITSPNHVDEYSQCSSRLADKGLLKEWWELFWPQCSSRLADEARGNPQSFEQPSTEDVLVILASQGATISQRTPFGNPQHVVQRGWYMCKLAKGCKAKFILIVSGFADYMASGSDAAYQQLCSEVTVEFNDCSKQVLEMESLFMSPAYGREDLAHLLRSVQIKEKQKLNLDGWRAMVRF